MRARGRKWISLLLTLCMVLSLLPVTALAAENITYTEDTTIYTTSLRTDTIWTVEAGVTATVNGMITVPLGVTLTLQGSGTLLRNYKGSNGMFYVNGGTLIIDGVTIDGNGENIAITGSTNKSNAIKINGASGSCTMKSGTIQNCKQEVFGAAIYVSSQSSFTMEGGAIRNNTMTSTTSTYGGAGLYNLGTSIIQGGSFTGNSATCGGAIYNASSGKLTISGGEIYDNTATKLDDSGLPCGDSVYHSALQDATGELYLGEAADIQGNIYLDNTKASKFVYLTGALHHPLAVTCGEAVEGRVVVQGSNHTVTAQDMARLSIKNSGWYFGLSGENNQIFITSKNTEAYLPITIQSDDGSLDVQLNQSGETVALDYDASQNAYIGNVKAGTYDVFVGGQDTGNDITVSVTETVFGPEVLLMPHVHAVSSTMDDSTFDPLSSLGSTLGPGNYYLTKDLTNGTDDHITISGDVTLCLNGKTLDLNGKHIVVPTGSSLTLCDCGSGKITGQNYTAGNSNGYGSVYVQGGSCTMYSGSITGNNAYSGGGVNVNDGGSFVMHGGSITGNTAQLGGGVSVSSGSFAMYGGTISGNEATTYGSAGVNVASDGSFTMHDSSIINNWSNSGNGSGGMTVAGSFIMYGGKISGNQTSASTYGGGVHMAHGGSFTLSGDASITGNTSGRKDCNVYLENNAVITIGGQLTGGKIGVTMENRGVFTKDWGSIMGDAAPADYFSSEDSAYLVARTSNGEAMLHQHSYTYTAVRDTITESCTCGYEATATISIPDGTDLTYTGSALMPAVVNYDTEWQGGTLTPNYENNINVGTATATITKDKATASVTFEITAKAYSGGSFTMNPIDDQTYTGKQITPDVTVKFGSTTLKKGADYDLSYGNNVNVGTGSVTIQFQGNYTGETTVSFNIVYTALTGDASNDTVFEDYTDTCGNWSNSDSVTFETQNDWEVSTTPDGEYGKSVNFDVSGKADGTHTETVYVKDSSGNIYQTEITYQLDKTAPEVSDLTASRTEWTADNVAVSFTASDSPSDIAGVTVSQDGGEAQPVTGSGGNYAFTAESNGSYTVTVTDNAGNTTIKTIQITNIDKTQPTLSVTGGHESGKELTLTVTASNSGVSDIQSVTVQKTGGDVVNITNASEYQITEPGVYTFTATTGAGITTTVTKTVHSIDFSSDGGSSVDRQLVADGGKVTKPAPPTKDGYTLDRWQSNGADWNFENGIVTSDLTLTATWMLNKPTVTLEATPAANAAYHDGKTVITLTANASHDADVAYTYQWYKTGNDTPIQGNGKSLTLTDVEESGEYKVVVTATDGSQETTAAATAAVTIDPKSITGTWQGLNQVYGSSEPVSIHPDGLDTGDSGAGITYHYTGINGTVYDSADLPTQAGTYTVTATMDNYKFTNGTATLVIQKKPVVITVTDNAVAAGDTPEEPTIHVPSELEKGDDYTVTYKDQDGNPADLTQPGTYEVWVEFTDPNYRHPDGSSQAPVGSVTVSETQPHSYTVTFDGNGATGQMADLTLAGGSTLTLPQCSYTKSESSFTGWLYDGKTYQPGDRFTVPNETVTFTAQWQETFTVTGIVTEKTDTTDTPVVANAVVSLWLGANQLYETTTDSHGAYRFEHLIPGIYNLVVSKDVRTVTSKVEIQDANTVCNAVLPKGATNSIVEVTPGSPNIVVGKLDTVFETTDETVFTVEDAEKVSEGGKVEVTFTVAEQTEAQIGEDVLKDLQSVGGSNLSLFLECTLAKAVYDNSSQEDVISQPLEQSSVLLEIRMPLPTDLQGKYGYTISRMHGGKAQTVPLGESSKNADGEYFTVSEDKTTLILHVKCFSTYAVGYTEQPSGGATTHPPVQQEGENGSYTLSPSRPAAGQTVTITPKPDKGYVVGSVTVADKNGNDVAVTSNDDGTYTFTHPGGSVTITVTFRKDTGVADCPRDESCPMAPFIDADRDAWYHDGVHYCVEHGLMVGTSKTTFAPNVPITRGMIVTILWRLEGSPLVSTALDYDDVAPEAWYGEAVRWADSAGVVTGYGNGKFGPNDPITREQMAAMLWRYAGSPAVAGSLSSFVDGAQTSGWAQPAMIWAVDQGLIAGVGNDRLEPRGQATRAQAATILMRFAQDMGK